MSPSGLIVYRRDKSGRGPQLTLMLVALTAGLALGGRAGQAEFLPVWGGPTYDATTGNGFSISLVGKGPHVINDAGTAVGSGRRHIDHVDVGNRAFRWSVGGGPVVELGHLGTDSEGRTVAGAGAIAADGTAVGYADKYSGAGTFLGERAVRWEPGSTVAIELGNLGIPPSGFTSAIPVDVNAGGTAVGFAFKYDQVNNLHRGRWAVRWDAGGTTATELESISFDDRQADGRSSKRAASATPTSSRARDGSTPTAPDRWRRTSAHSSSMPPPPSPNRRRGQRLR